MVLFCFTVSWIAISLAAQREPTLTSSDRDINRRVVYMLLVAELATIYAIFTTPTLAGKIATLVVFEIATLDFWLLSKFARARYILDVLRRNGWPAFKTVDFLKLPWHRVIVPVKKTGKYTDRLVNFAIMLSVLAMVLRFIFTFPDVSTGMAEYCYAILVMSVAATIAILSEVETSKTLKIEVEHMLQIVRRKNRYATELTPQQYEIAKIFCFRDSVIAVTRKMFFIVLTTALVLGGVYWAITQLSMTTI